MNNTTKLIIAIALLIVAAMLFTFQYRSSSETQRTSTHEVERQIQEIQNNPHMPPQAKEAAIQQIRMRQQQPGSVTQGVSTR